MADDNLEISNSPSSISGGGKFASKRPYIIAGVLLGLFLIGMIYATSVRGEQSKKQEEKKEVHAKSDTSKIDELLEGLKGKNKLMDKPKVEQVQYVPQVPIILEAPKERKLTEAEKERLRILKMKQKQLEAAISAPMSVSSGDITGLMKQNGEKTTETAPQAGMDILNKYLENYDKFNQPNKMAIANKTNKIGNAVNAKHNGIFKSKDDGYLTYQKRKQLSPYELKTGSLIPAVLISGINSELPGKILAQVRENVYDTATGDHLLIPQGTKLVGVYGSDAKYGQNRALIAFNRLIFPDGQTLNIGAMNGVDGGGFGGFEDEVDHHYFRVFGSAFLMSILGGDIGFNDGKLTFRTESNENSQRRETALEKAAGRVIEKGLNLAPTITIRNGYRFNIFVTKDMILEPLSSYMDNRNNSSSHSEVFERNNKAMMDVRYDRSLYHPNQSTKQISTATSEVVAIP